MIYIYIDIIRICIPIILQYVDIYYAFNTFLLKSADSR